MINYEHTKPFVVERHLISSFRKIGFYSLSQLIQYSEAGMSIHYGGSLPMRKEPQKRYETWPDGRLYGSKHIYIGDAAGFPQLPSKNLTFTIMANSMRIAEYVRNEIQKTS